MGVPRRLRMEEVLVVEAWDNPTPQSVLSR